MAKTKKVTKKTRNNVTSKEIGKRIKERRKKLQMTQAELGEKSFLAEKTISAIENGRRNASLESIERISDALDVDKDYLLLRIDYPKHEVQQFANFVKHTQKTKAFEDLMLELFDLSKYNIVKCSYDEKDNLINIANLPKTSFDDDEIERLQIIRQNSFYAIKDSEGNLFPLTHEEYNKMCYELVDYSNFIIKHMIYKQTPLSEKLN